MRIAAPGENAAIASPPIAGPSPCIASGRTVPSSPFAASSSSSGRSCGSVAVYAGTKKASPAPIANPASARCQSSVSPAIESAPTASTAAARRTSAESINGRRATRSAVTPATRTKAIRPTLVAAATIES